MRDQTAHRADLHCEEISGRNTLPVRLQKRRPRRALSSFGRRIDALFDHDRGQRTQHSLRVEKRRERQLECEKLQHGRDTRRLEWISCYERDLPAAASGCA